MDNSFVARARHPHCALDCEVALERKDGLDQGRALDRIRPLLSFKDCAQ